MAQVIIEDLDDQVIENLRQKAHLHGRSLEQEMKEILAQAARPTTNELLALADEIRSMTPQRSHPFAEDLIREDRDRR